jgi:YidC/Oxa1 family membrane protein insertase
MLLDPIAKPLGQFLFFIYNTIGFQNYGLAIIMFTFIVKIALLPLTLKQQKSAQKMQVIQPKMEEIKKRYKNDKEKLNQEMMKLYQENKVNPAGGCFPLLLQFPILISLYWVITQPLKFMLSKSPAVIFALKNIAGIDVKTYGGDINALTFFEKNQDLFNAKGELIWQAGKAGEFGEFIIDSVGNIINRTGDILVKVGDAIFNQAQLINFNFLGLDLSQIATYNPDKLFGPESHIYLPLLLLPIIGVVTTFISSKMTMPQNTQDKKKSSAQGSAGGMGKSMMYIGPIMTLYFSFILPAGVVLYWIIGYVFQILQQLYINKRVLIKKEEVAE